MAESTDDIEAIIITLLKSVLPEGSTVTVETQLARDLEFDSVAMMDFTLALEDRIGLPIPLDRIVEIETVADLCRAVEGVVAQSR